MTTRSIPRLRPLSVGQILDRAIRLYRHNFFTFVGIIAVVQVPISLLSLIIALFGYQPPALAFEDEFYLRQILSSLAQLVLTLVSVVLISGLATAALTQAIAEGYFGESVGFMEAYRKIGGKWGRLVGAILLAMLFSLLLFIWLLIPCIGWATGGGMLFFFATVITPLVAPIVVLEDKAAGAAIRRAWDLARRRFWPVVGFVVILFLFNLLLVSGPTLLFTFVFQFAGETLVPSRDPFVIFAVQTVVTTLVQILMSMLYTPLQLTAMTLLYFDLRVRTEGFDLTMLAQSALAEEEPEMMISRAPPPEGGALITGTELAYFLGLSVGFGAVYALFVGVILAIFGVTFAALPGTFGP
ncbi:MAG: glycerophosphoryl diester phosphodiesterase membrane domain-containing protein [Anaerolineales bacterium]